MAAKKAVKKAVTKKKPARNARGSGVNPDSAYGQTIVNKTEENLSPKGKARRDRFVMEYLYDFSASNAWRRMKAWEEPDKALEEVPADKAAEYGYKLTQEPYVANKIREAVDAAAEADMINAKRVLSMAIREANYHGMGAAHSARVASIRFLGDVLAMTSSAKAAVQRTEPKAAGPRGGVMVVPETAKLETWEVRSKKAQAKLKEDVRK